MSERNALLNKISAYSFAEKEWNLYLDTHPTDKEGLAIHRKMADKAAELINEYERMYGPLTTMGVTDENCFNWLCEPWPWENQ